MLRCTRLLSTTPTPIVSKVQALIGWKKSEEIVKTICNLKPSEIDEHDWHVITDQLISFSEQTKSASVIPSVVIASASLGYSVPDIDKERIGNLAISLLSHCRFSIKLSLPSAAPRLVFGRQKSWI